ncbi:MAG TPA: hypothetical protein VNJ04_04990 [Gemmatimonadaceae bacterium]|nr:hypothetical protein [Gemmatimonadaceae bacterium]
MRLVLVEALVMLRCELEREDGTECAQPAVWETDDLGETHYLCDECCTEAMRFDTFRTTEVAA